MNPGWYMLFLSLGLLIYHFVSGIIKGKSFKQLFFKDWF